MKTMKDINAKLIDMLTDLSVQQNNDVEAAIDFITETVYADLDCYKCSYKIRKTDIVAFNSHSNFHFCSEVGKKLLEMGFKCSENNAYIFVNIG